MKRSQLLGRTASIALPMLLAPTLAAAQSIAPAATPIKGDLIRIGDLFHIDYFNVRITAIVWLPGSDPVGKAIEERTNQEPPADGKGFLEIDAETKNATRDSAMPPSPYFQVIFKDGSQTDDTDAMVFRGAQLFASTNYQPGAGPALRYIIANVPKPTGDFLVTKIIIKPAYSENDAGAPRAFRMLTPPVTIKG